MSSILDDPNFVRIITEFDNESCSCIFRISDLNGFKNISEALDSMPEARVMLSEAAALIEQAQDKMDLLTEHLIKVDNTEYFEDKYFSNMGWIMLARKLDADIASPIAEVMLYINQRTNNDKRCASALHKLVRQGLVQRRRLSIPSLIERKYVETFETCLSLTEKGMELLSSDSFIYNSSYGSGTEPVTKKQNNVVSLLDRRKDVKANTEGGTHL